MKVAVIGSGNVGSAVAKAAKETGHDVTVADLEGTESLSSLGEELQVETTTSNADAVRGSDLVVLAVPSARSIPSSRASRTTSAARSFSMPRTR